MNLGSLGINNFRDGVEAFAYIVGSLSIFLGVIAYFLTRQQFQHDVMVSCIERFQDILPVLASNEPEKKLMGLRQYIDLCNEELFYFKNGYVPGEVAREWLDGMITYLPLFDKQGNMLAGGKYKEITVCDLLDDYPRIRKAFCIAESPNLCITEQRMKVIRTVQNNLKHLTYPCT